MKHLFTTTLLLVAALPARYLGTPLQEAADHVIKGLIGGEGRTVVSSNGYGVLYGQVTESGEPLVRTREPGLTP